jgi:hypothetical protein
MACSSDMRLGVVRRTASSVPDARTLVSRLVFIGLTSIPGLRTAKDIRVALDYMKEAWWVWPAPSREGDMAGRQRSDYIVNPKLRGAP